MERILPGEVAWYVTGRFYVAEDGSVRDAGYFLHLQGNEGGLFSGDPGEGTAHLTFLSDPFTATQLTNGDLTLGLDAVGEFAVYLNRRPGASFDDPASFGAGEEIARFRRVSIVVGTTVAVGKEGRPLFSGNVFSARLVSSRPFELGGRRYDLRRLLPHGVTQWGTAAATAAAELPGFTSVVPFMGSAIAIAGAH
ncbi:MAG TPA: hypothetical protein VFX98_03745 [Longimicrobiaceae bacterium]|nr:hypothetical protein [Longimicrobiaceae bacterium]